MPMGRATLLGSGALVELRTDARELVRRRVAEERDGEDAHHGDQGHEEGVLDERGTTLVIDASPQPVGEELERGDHVARSLLDDAVPGTASSCSLAGISD